jgi:phage tail tape-measure protein
MSGCREQIKGEINMTDESMKTATQLKAENDKTAGMAGAGAGVLAGAQVGTVLLPIPVVGTFTGALVGGLIGTKVGKKLGGFLLDKVSPMERPDVPAPSHTKANMSQQLEHLAQLHAAGVLTEDEFKAAKAKLLGL